MSKLLANAQEVDYGGRHRVKVPQLKDLLGMKVFALSNGGAKREDKDFWDIVKLVIENRFDVKTELRELCRRFGTEALYTRISTQIETIEHD